MKFCSDFQLVEFRIFLFLFSEFFFFFFFSPFFFLRGDASKKSGKRENNKKMKNENTHLLRWETENLTAFLQLSSIFAPILIKFSRNFAEYSRKYWEFLEFQNFLENSEKISWILIEFWQNSDHQKFEWFDRSPIEPLHILQKFCKKWLTIAIFVQFPSTFAPILIKFSRNFAE